MKKGHDGPESLLLGIGGDVPMLPWLPWLPWRLPCARAWWWAARGLCDEGWLLGDEVPPWSLSDRAGMPWSLGSGLRIGAWLQLQLQIWLQLRLRLQVWSAGVDITLASSRHLFG